MRRSSSEQEHQALRELSAVDAALAGDRVEPELSEIRDLALALREERELPRPRFAEQLDARARAGFPVHRRDPAERAGSPNGRDAQARAFAGLRGLPRRVRPARKLRVAPLALGAVASLFIIAVAVVSSGVLSSGGTTESGTTEPRGTAASPSQPGTLGEPSESGKTSASGDAAPGLPSPPGSLLPSRRTRQVERAASLVLAAPEDQVEGIADKVIEVTDRYRGFVLRSTVSGGQDGQAGATLDLRVPESRLQDAIRDLSALGHVRSRTQTTEDVTARFVSSAGRLREALAERAGLLRQLAKADTPNETASIRARLRLANRDIAAARARLRALRNRVSYSAVSLAIVADNSVTGHNRSTLSEGLDDAFGILGGSLAVALVALAVLVPLAIVSLLVWAGSVAVVRRRRERALDAGTVIEKQGGQ